MLPLVSFILIMSAETLKHAMHRHPWKVAFWTKLYIICEIVCFFVQMSMHQRNFVVFDELSRSDPPVDSILVFDRYSSPILSLLHR